MLASSPTNNHDSPDFTRFTVVTAGSPYAESMCSSESIDVIVDLFVSIWAMTLYDIGRSKIVDPFNNRYNIREIRAGL